MWVSWKALNQKLGILSFPGDFHLLDFFRVCLRFSRVISLHSCYFRTSYSLLSFSIHGAWGMWVLLSDHIFSQKTYLFLRFYFFQNSLNFLRAFNIIFSPQISWFGNLCIVAILNIFEHFQVRTMSVYLFLKAFLPSTIFRNISFGCFNSYITQFCTDYSRCIDKVV